MWQHAKKDTSNSLGLVNFATGLVNSVLNLPEGQVKFFEIFKLLKNSNQCCQSKILGGGGGLLKTLGLVHISNNLPKWQAVKPTF